MVSQMELSTTCRHVGRGLIPRPQLIRRRCDLRLAVHRSKECDLFVASANSGRQENRSRPPKQQRTKDRRTGRCRCRGPRQQHRARLCLGRRLGADGRHSTRNHRNCGPAVALPRLSRRVPLRVPSPPQPTFSPLGFNFDTDLGILSRNTPVVTYSTSADISRFVDPGVPVLGTIKYYEEMAEQFGGLDRAQRFSRFYPVPNMGHCSGGSATDTFDLLTLLANWVENGTPPRAAASRGNYSTSSCQLET
jgi:hypothetical protein